MTNLQPFTPLLRQTVGFDRFNDLFESILNGAEERFDAYPPYNIEKTSEDDYQIVLAVAGFSESDLNIIVEDDHLHVSAKTVQNEGEVPTYLHRGIASRGFERRFRLADHIKVDDARLENGLLTISLTREVPEEKKPRMIAINGDQSMSSQGTTKSKLLTKNNKKEK